MAILRFPLVAFGFVVEHLKRLPGATHVAPHTSLVATGLMLAAFVALVVWGSQRAPQRISLAELAAGALSPMQSWIVVSGELRADSSRSSGFRYRLTDPAVPNAAMNVLSSVELPVGQTTVSGMFLGPREPVPVAVMFTWVGQMRADPVLTQEPPPPWMAIALAAAGLLVGVSGRFSYPMFFDETPHGGAPRTMTLRVGVRRQMATSAGQIIPATLRMKPGAPVELHVSGATDQPTRIYAAHTSVIFGELRMLFRSEPVLRVRQPIGDLDIIFASRDDRDAAFAALAAEHHGARRPRC